MRRDSMSPFAIRTLSGLSFDFANPNPDMIVIDDIANGLAQAARCAGQGDVKFSCAQHSILVSNLVPEPYRFQALMHDAAEGYTGDVPKPLKRLLGASFKRIETRIEAAIGDRFGFDPVMPACVKWADTVAYGIERVMLHGDDPATVGLDGGLDPAKHWFDEVWDWLRAKREFLQRFEELYSQGQRGVQHVAAGGDV